MHLDKGRAISVLDKQLADPAMQEDTAAFEQLLQQARNNNHRALIVLSGSPDWCRSTAKTLLSLQQAVLMQQAVWIGNENIPAGKCRQLLGSEYVAAVFDVHDGLHPDALAAVAGTVIAGGVLILLTPSLDVWPDTPDPDYERLASYPYDWRCLSQRFVSHLRTSVQRAANQTGCLLVREQNCPGCHAVPLALPELPQRATGELPSVEQRRCLQQLQGHESISVVLAGRGHGKSALLGFAARDWLARGKRVLLVAPSRASALSVFRHAKCELPFLAPDKLLQDATVSADVLLVDEAAAIPQPMLLDLLARFPHAVLATTTDGYEGTGQGFLLRFLRELDAHCPAWQRLALPSPVRWAEGDPLENWLYCTLLLDATEPVCAQITETAVAETLTQQQLLDDPVLLRDVYGLLRSAHYRTAPDDLRFLLDGPALSLYRLVCNEQTIAVAMVVEEGGLDAGMAAEIAAGRRRPRGHLLVQTMAIHEQQPQYLQQRVARVVRIAVHTKLQGRGLGSQLLQTIIADQQARGVCAVGSSFSATPEVLAFWQRNGFDLVRIGHKKQAASAAPSALVLRHL